MFKALFIALAAAAGWTTVSGQDTAFAVPTSPLPMLSLQSPEAPQTPEAAPAPQRVEDRLQRVADPRRVKLRKARKPAAPRQVRHVPTPVRFNVKAPQEARVIHEVKAHKGLAQNERRALLEQIQLLQAENTRLQDSMQVRSDRARQSNDAQRAVRDAQRAIRDEQRVLRSEQRAVASERAAEARVLAHEARVLYRQGKEAHPHQVHLVSPSDHANVLREMLHTTTDDSNVTLDIQENHLHGALRNLEKTLHTLEVQSDGPHMVHLHEILEQCGVDANGDHVEIEVLMEHLDHLHDSMEDNHEFLIEGVELRLEGLEELIEENEMGNLQVLLESLDGQILNMDSLNVLKNLKVLEGFESLEGLENHKHFVTLDEIDEIDGLVHLELFESFHNLRFPTGASSCDRGSDSCCESDGCDESDCCDTDADTIIERILINENKSGNVLFELRSGHGNKLFTTKDGEAHVFFEGNHSKPTPQTFFIREGDDSDETATMIEFETGQAHFGWTTTTPPDAGSHNWTTSTTIDCTKHRWNTSHSSTGADSHSCGTSVIKIQNDGGHIYIDTKNGRTQVKYGSDSNRVPATKAENRVFFSIDSPPAPACPPVPACEPTECDTAPSCDTSVKTNSGVSMRVYPNRTDPIVSSFLSLGFAGFPQDDRDYTFASQPHAKDSTLVELERMLNEVLREVDALQVEVNRVRTAVHKNQTR
ncbi:MAG: hypothetical protein JKY61_01540 [Planctomycetes bacterium]|nr:hypothetical protein [Planctomycetota bacterium]